MRGVEGSERPLDYFVAASREEHPGMTVINKAKALRARHFHTLSGPGRQHPTTQLAQRVDGMVDEGRFSASAVVVGNIAAKIRGVPNPHCYDRVRDALIALLKSHVEELDVGMSLGNASMRGKTACGGRWTSLSMLGAGSTYALDVAVVDRAAPHTCTWGRTSSQM